MSTTSPILNGDAEPREELMPTEAGNGHGAEISEKTNSEEAFESRTSMLQRHALEREQLAKNFELKKSGIPRKDRAGRARLAEEHAAEGKALQQRHAAELETSVLIENESVSLAENLEGLSLNHGIANVESNISESKGARRRRKRKEKQRAAEINEAPNVAAEIQVEANVNDTPPSSEAPTGQKLSRAARRRLKRQQEEAASEQRIAEERAAMGPGERQIEMDALREQLTEHKLRVHQVAADGNCMYNAILHQLDLVGNSAQFEPSVNGLRSATADYMVTRAAEFMPFIESVENDPSKFEAYCEELRTEPVWGGQVELQALVGLLRVTILVFAVGLPIVKMGETGPVLKLSYHRKYFGLGEHYNSLVPIQ